MIGTALEDAIVGEFAVALVDNLAVVPDTGEIASSRRWHTGTALALADSLPVSHLAAVELGALTVNRPHALGGADPGGVSGGVALRLAWGAFDRLVAVCGTAGTLVAGAGLVASLSDVPTARLAVHG